MTEEPGWMPVALSENLAPGTSAGTRLFGRELVLWRGRDGQVHAWEDRCPHRGMRLSFGFVRGDRLACLYHGWQYDGAGRCRFIPAHPDLDVPETIRVTSYAVTEATGIVWVFWGDQAATAPPADLQVGPLRSLYVDVAADQLRAFLLAAGAVAAGAALLRVDADGVPLLGGVQPIAEDRSALHLVFAARSIDGVATIGWAEDLRRRIEAAPETVA